QNDSLHVNALDDGRLFVGNSGGARTYEIILWTGSPTSEDFGQVMNITLDSAAGQWLAPDWDNLMTNPVVVANDTDGDGAPDDTTLYNVVTDVEDTPDEELPLGFELQQNYPNPFNPTTTIEFSLPSQSRVRLDVYNVLGQRVNTLVDKELSAGSYAVEWNGRNNAGTPVATGVYFYRLTTDEYTSSKKMLLLK
ncbi:T9SS type A sorting domain-containing protein, partial [candidate division GN15 bacterium]|nr:T9SS type A sorting domain-containing protein [candidate division GN15 bacterium]